MLAKIKPHSYYCDYGRDDSYKVTNTLLMVQLCTKEDSGSNGACQMCIVTGPNIDFAAKLIRRLKKIFKRKLEPTFTDKETVLSLNPIRCEAH